MKHLFFDLDRTLWDFETNSKNALKILFDTHALDREIKSFESFHKSYKTHNARLWNQYGKGKLSKEILRVKRFDDTLKQYQIFNKELAEKIADGYVEISPHQTNVFPGTHDTLGYLKKESYQMHIITNGFKEVQFIKLENSGLLEYFDIIVCSEDVGKNKPEPDVFHHSLQQAGAKKEESVMIGDDYKVDIVGASNIGMSAILFDPGKKYKEGTHEWHIDHLEKIPETIPWIKQSKL